MEEVGGGALVQSIYHRNWFLWLRNKGYKQNNNPISERMRTDRGPLSPRKGKFQLRYDLSEGQACPLVWAPHQSSLAFWIAGASNCPESVFIQRKKQPQRSTVLCLTLNYGRKQDDKVTMPIKEWYIPSQGHRELWGKDKSLVTAVRVLLILDLHKLWTSPWILEKLQIGMYRYIKRKLLDFHGPTTKY